MLTTLITILVITLVIGVISFAFWRISKLSELARWYESENMPRELRWASLFASEQEIQCEIPVPLSGIPDQIYQTLFGKLVVVDTKTRNQAVVYPADILQLSVYRVILEHTTQDHFAQRRLKPYAYIRLSTPEEVRYERVDLLDNAEVIRYYQRYQALLSAQSQPEFTEHPGLCRHCSHRRVCPAMDD